jgi:hypothetical protein
MEGGQNRPVPIFHRSSWRAYNISRLLVVISGHCRKSTRRFVLEADIPVFEGGGPLAGHGGVYNYRLPSLDGAVPNSGEYYAS